MKNKKLKSALTLIIILLTFSLYAQGPPGGGQGGGRGQGQQGGQRGGKPDASKILEKLDTNNDKVIDKDEASKDQRGKIAEDFDEIDTNDDEVIDLEELKASLNDRKPKKISAKKIIKELDDNDDGTLNKLEVAAKNKKELSENFSEIDTNNDNELDLEELKAFYAKNLDKPKKNKRRERD
ncbi:EF-hand domain-containing protein [Olleya aquimaris]|uniref:EF hand domain-containing protein n=1 Tax=Olleya aquimaris TaxID=639310 RepID=A0A327RMX7_9FLAO|nr:EF-hand domain-containing protein [Olleya aquimaris]RAJ16883.1 EF hand domain-containing protein [Olleya aquimaris]